MMIRVTQPGNHTNPFILKIIVQTIALAMEMDTGCVEWLLQ
jgi:hypothetical protein